MKMHWDGLREEVSQVVRSLTPSDAELFLADSISYPVELHIDGFCFLGSDSIGGEANSAHVVTQNVGCRLGVAETVKNSSDRGPLFGIHKHRCILCFSN